MTSDAANHGAASYWPALDGLRGVAILMVFAFHLPYGPFRAGSYGVILFFVLSGFLITTILLRELDEKGTVNLRRFYTRRARRLFPALLVVIVAHLLLQFAVLGEPERWWDRSWPVLAYVSNYVEIGGTQLVHMTHTWSLAVEEHFYLLWPVMLIAMPRRWRFATTCTLTAAFALWRLGLLMADVPHDRIYFATDTNVFAPLLGCVVAIGLHEKRIPAPTRNLSALAISALIVATCIPWQYLDRRLLYGTLPVAILAALAVHGALVKPAAWLENPVLRWFGKVSYGLYLWHYMMISLPWEQLLPIPPLVPMIVTPIALAWMSWRYVEAPLLGRRAPARPSLPTQENVDPPASHASRRRHAEGTACCPHALIPLVVVDGSTS